MNTRALTGVGFATLAAMSWVAALGAASRLPANLPVEEVVAIRYSLQLAFLVVLVLPIRGRAHLVRTSRPKLQIARALTMVAMPITFEFGVQRVGASEALAGIWLAPLFGIWFVHAFAPKKLTRTGAGVAVAATLGALVAHTPDLSFSIRGTVALLLAATAFGAFFALTAALRDEHPSTGLFWTALGVAACFLPALPFVWHRPTVRAVVALVALSGLWMVVLYAVDEALRRAPLELITPFLLTEVLWIRLAFRAPWSAASGAGALILLASAFIALVMLARPGGQSSQPSPDPIV
jgi:drug/metabolite transporter (DMT)-like permease